MHNDILLSELEKEEKVFWSGRPDSSGILNASDLLFIPLGLFPMAGSIVMILMGFGLLFSPEDEGGFIPLVVFLSFIPMLVGFYLSFGRLIHKRRKRQRTLYAVTNNRIIVLSEGNKTQINSLPLKEIREISKSKYSDGVGTIYFGRPNPFSLFEDSGLEFFSKYYLEACIVFRDIGNVDEVYNLIQGNR